MTTARAHSSWDAANGVDIRDTGSRFARTRIRRYYAEEHQAHQKARADEIDDALAKARGEQPSRPKRRRVRKRPLPFFFRAERTARQPVTGHFVLIETRDGFVAAQLRKIGLEIRCYRLGHRFLLSSYPPTIATYFRGNSQLAALLRRDLHVMVRSAHGWPQEPHGYETLEVLRAAQDPYVTRRRRSK